MMRKNGTGQRLFTLIELLVVLVIAMIMAGMGVATFTAVVRGTAVETASRQLGGAAAYARQLAISQRRRCALVMPGGLGAAGSLDPGKQYIAFRLAFVNNSNQFVEWVPDSRWLFVPPSVAIMEADGDLGIQDSSGHRETPFENQASTINDVNLGELGGGTTVDNVRAIVFLANGRLHGAGAKYITVGRAQWNGTSWDIARPDTNPDNPNRSCADQITIMINKFTGSISYLYPDEY